MIKKCVYILFIIFFLLFNIININVVYGTSQIDSSGDSIISGANGFIELGEDQVGDALNTDKLADASNSIYNILLAIAMIIAVAVGVGLGIKFMTSSVDEQAKIKEMLVPYVAGCIVVFGAMGIWKLAVTTFSKF